MKIEIRILKVSDVSQEYVDWFSKKEVIRYSHNQYRSFSLEGQKNYVDNCLNNKNIELYGIFDGKLHLGNIVLDGLCSKHKRAEIKYVIGNTDYWGMGVGSFAVSKIIEISKNKHNLNKLFAGISENNKGSRKVLEKNGFNLEGKRIKHLLFEGKFQDQLDFGLIL